MWVCGYVGERRPTASASLRYISVAQPEANIRINWTGLMTRRSHRLFLVVFALVAPLVVAILFLALPRRAQAERPQSAAHGDGRPGQVQGTTAEAKLFLPLVLRLDRLET